MVVCQVSHAGEGMGLVGGNAYVFEPSHLDVTDVSLAGCCPFRATVSFSLTHERYHLACSDKVFAITYRTYSLVPVASPFGERCGSIRTRWGQPLTGDGGAIGTKE